MFHAQLMVDSRYFNTIKLFDKILPIFIDILLKLNDKSKVLKPQVH